MTTDRKNHLRRVMTLAWGLFREPGGDRSFSDALRGAWKFVSALARMKPLPRSGRIVFKDTLRSPIRSRWGARAAVGGRASANYLTAVVGA